MTHKNILFLILQFLITECFVFSQSQTTRINVQSAKQIDINEIITDVQILSLKDNISFYLNDPWKIRIYDTYVYIYSLSDLTIHILKTNGDYIKTLRYKSTEQFTYPVDFIIKEDKQELWVLNEYNKILRYTLNGEKLIGQINVPYQISSFTDLSIDYLLLFDGYLNRTTNGHLLCYNMINKQISAYVNIVNHTKLNGIVPATCFARYDESVFALLPHNDTIFKSYRTANGEPKILPYLTLNFEGYFLDYHKWPDEGYTDKAFADIISSKRYVYSITSFYAASNKLFFQTKGKLNSYYAIDLKTNELFAFNSLIEGLQTTTAATSIIGASVDQLYFFFNKTDIVKHYTLSGNHSKYNAITHLLDNQEKYGDYIILTFTIKH